MGDAGPEQDAGGLGVWGPAVSPGWNAGDAHVPRQLRLRLYFIVIPVSLPRPALSPLPTHVPTPLVTALLAKCQLGFCPLDREVTLQSVREPE